MQSCVNAATIAEVSFQEKILVFYIARPIGVVIKKIEAKGSNCVGVYG
jgi:hypothetical protein